MNTYRVEEHLWAEEALVANIDIHHVSVDCLVHESLELGRLDDLAVNCLLLIELRKLLVRVTAHITILLLDL